MATDSSDAKQPPQDPKFNHPLELDGERGDDISVVIPLHRALTEGDLKSVEEIFKHHADLVRYSISASKETPPHVAIMRRRTDLVPCLVDMMSEEDLKLQNSDGNTAFCLAAISGNVDMAEIMVEKNPELSLTYATENTMPLCLAASHGKRDMVKFLLRKSNGMQGKGWTEKHRNEVLLKCIQANMFDVAKQILKDHKELPQDKYVLDVLQELAQKPEEFNENAILNDRPHTCFLNIPAEKFTPIELLGLLLERVTEKLKDFSTWFLKRREEKTIPIELLGLLLKSVTEKRKDFTHEIPKKTERDQIEKYLSQILFMAAKENNIIFLVKLINEYPDLIWQRNDDGQSFTLLLLIVMVMSSIW